MRPERWLALASLALFLLSLALPALEGDAFPVQRGVDLLRRGAGLWSDRVFAWYANPALIVSVLATWLGYCRTGLAAAAAGLMLALSSYTAAAALESAGRSVPEFAFAGGYYVWLGAFLLAILASGTAVFCKPEIPEA